MSLIWMTFELIGTGGLSFWCGLFHFWLNLRWVLWSVVLVWSLLVGLVVAVLFVLEQPGLGCVI